MKKLEPKLVKNSINDEKYNEYKKKKIFRIIYIILSLIIIILEILALFNVISMYWGLGIFVLLVILKKKLWKQLIFEYFFDIISI